MPITPDESRIPDVLSDLATALQGAAPLADRLNIISGLVHDDAARLDAAIVRAVAALTRLEPPARAERRGERYDDEAPQ